MNLNETMQHIFDTVVPLLIQQGKSSVETEVDGRVINCMYRGDGGSKCAIGWLIADDRYSPDFERRGAVDAMKSLNWMPNPELDLTQFSGDQVFHSFLCSLQACHDNASDTTEFVRHFKKECISLLSRYVSIAAL
jgi:hypothetical protein